MRTPREAIPPFPRGYSESRPHQWTRDELDTLLGWIIDQATGVRTELHAAWGRVVDWTPGLSAGAGVAVSGGRTGDDGAVNGRTQAAALRALTDSSSNAAQDFHIIALGAVQASRIVGRMTAAKVRLRVAEPADDVLEPAPRSRVGQCANPVCGHWCSGIDNDRRRFGGLPDDDRRTGGRCLKCWRYRRDHDGEERSHALCVANDADHPIQTCKLCRRDQLIAEGHDVNDVVSLVDQGGKR